MPLPPDHPMHGTRRGYQLGCHEECCRRASSRAAKLLRLRTQERGPTMIDAAPTREVLLWWDARGVALDAVGEAAGLCPNNLHDIARGEQPRVHRDTAAALLGVGEDALPGTSSINSNVTRARIFSMMAAGHELLWIAGNADFGCSGKWRYYERTKVSTARKVRDLYRGAPLLGPSLHTRNRTRNRGHLPPLAWDDPGTLGEPDGWKPGLEIKPDRSPIFDEAAVLRRMAGDMTVTMHRAESEEVVRRLAAKDWSLAEITRHTGLQASRYRHVLTREEGAA